MGALTLLPALLASGGLVAASHNPFNGMHPSVTAVALTEYVYTPNHGMAVTMTESTKTVGNTVLVIMPATTIVPFRMTPNEAAEKAETLKELLDMIHDAQYNMSAINTYLACEALPACRKMHSHLDWEKIAQTAKIISPHLDGDTDRATRYAALHALQRRRDTKTSTMLVGGMPKSTVSAAVVTGTDGSHTTIASLPATVGNTVYANMTTSLWDYAWAAQQTMIPDPPSCHGPFRNKTKCRYQKCLQQHYKPMNMTTVFQAAKFDSECTRLNVQNPWYTQPTSLTTPHFGTTQGGMLYYPHAPTVVSKKGKTWVAMATQKPAHDEGKGMGPLNAFKAPSCWDFHTCCAECHIKSRSTGWFGSFKHPFNFHKVLAYLMTAALLGLLGLLASCLLCCLPRFHNHRERRRRAAEEVARREKVTVVDPAPGVETVVVTTTPGQTIDPATAAAATGAAVVAANQATTSGADPADGRGTMARRAEEGRGHVQFAPPPPGGGNNTVVTGSSNSPAGAGPSGTGPGGQVVTTVTPGSAPDSSDKVTKTATPTDQEKSEPEKAANAAQQKTEAASGAPQVVVTDAYAPAGEAAPVPVHDGVYEWPPATGREYGDVGSLRGRKRGKVEGQQQRGGLLKLGF
ncbi:hypothetical protein LTR74_000942 [Friedmanniomyces endolithicus]|nr:hypothetical protein LTR74_000942 [Friedmanniomyces endolithicus]